MIRFSNGTPRYVWYSQHANGEAFKYSVLRKSGLRVRKTSSEIVTFAHNTLATRLQRQRHARKLCYRWHSRSYASWSQPSLRDLPYRPYRRWYSVGSNVERLLLQL